MPIRFRAAPRVLRCRRGLRWRGVDRADAELVRRTATWLRADPGGARDAGLPTDRDARAMAALLDLLAAELPHVEPSTRRATLAWCREALGAPSPTRASSDAPGRGPGRPCG